MAVNHRQKSSLSASGAGSAAASVSVGADEAASGAAVGSDASAGSPQGAVQASWATVKQPARVRHVNRLLIAGYQLATVPAQSALGAVGNKQQRCNRHHQRGCLPSGRLGVADFSY